MDWQPIEMLPAEYDKRPARMFVLLQGVKYHSDIFWARAAWGIASIRYPNSPDFDQGFAGEDLRRILDENDMDHYDYNVSHFLPCSIIPPFPADVRS